MSRGAIVALVVECSLMALSLGLAWASFGAGHVAVGRGWLAVTIAPLGFSTLIVRSELRDSRRNRP